MRRHGWILVASLLGCGDDGGQRRDEPDAAMPPDAEVDAESPDASIDAPVDGASTLVVESSFSAGLSSLCGIGLDGPAEEIHVYPCMNTSVHVFVEPGTLLRTDGWPGEIADDGDIEVAETTYTLGTSVVQPGDEIYINGETGVAELYAPPDDGAVTLAAAFGGSHVVGGSYHPLRGTFFLLQDRVAATAANTVAEIDAATGAVVQSFSTGAFDVSYGDLDVCNSTGEIFVVSSVQGTVAIFSPTGERTGTYGLPAQVATPSGLALTLGGRAYVSTTTGDVVLVSGLPCPN